MVHLQQVPGRPAQEPRSVIFAQGASKARDVGVKGCSRRTWGLIAPERPDDVVGRNHTIRVREEQHQQESLPMTGDVYGSLFTDHLKRAEHRESHAELTSSPTSSPDLATCSERVGPPGLNQINCELGAISKFPSFRVER